MSVKWNHFPRCFFRIHPDPRFIHVYERGPSFTGRLRAVRERRRNVHAVVRGRLLSRKPRGVACEVPVRYNPFRAATFTGPDGSPVLSAPVVRLADGRAYIPHAKV